MLSLLEKYNEPQYSRYNTGVYMDKDLNYSYKEDLYIINKLKSNKNISSIANKLTRSNSSIIGRIRQIYKIIDLGIESEYIENLSSNNLNGKNLNEKYNMKVSSKKEVLKCEKNDLLEKYKILSSDVFELKNRMDLLEC